MKVGAVEETITVTGETPIVDTQNVVQKHDGDARGDGRAADRPQLRQLRGDARRRCSSPACRQNVGGSIPETGMNLVVHGSRAGDSLIMVDGMPIINGSGSGGLQYGNYLNNALAQEITFQTDGTTPSSSARRSIRTSSRRKARTRSAARSRRASPTSRSRVDQPRRRRRSRRD